MVLPAPVAPTTPTRSPGSTVEGHVAQHVIVVLVGEPDAVELDVPGRGGVGGGAAPRAASISTGVSSSAKMRSEEAMAACRMLNFSERSLIGRKNRCEYCRKATSDPSVSVAASTSPPPTQMMRAAASAPTISIAG